MGEVVDIRTRKQADGQRLETRVLMSVEERSRLAERLAFLDMAREDLNREAEDVMRKLGLLPEERGLSDEQHNP